MIALPNWLVTNALVVAGLYPVAWLLCRLCRNRPAVSHLVWLVLLVKLVAPPLVYWPWSVRQVTDYFRPQTAPLTAEGPAGFTPVDDGTIDDQIALQPSHSGVEQSAPIPPVAETQSLRVAESQWSLATLLFLLWSLGASAITVGGLRGIWQQRRALRVCEPAPSYLADHVKVLARRFGIRAPAAFIRDRLSMPVLSCIGRPRLVWPRAMSDRETVTRCDGVLAHELAHLKRRDHWIVYVELVIAIVCWWNPLFWLIQRQLHQMRELACDAMALAVARQSRSEYAQELLVISTARPRTILLAPAFGAGLASRHFLKRRLTMVFDERVSGRTPAAGFALVLAVAAIALPATTLAEQAVVSAAPAAVAEHSPVEPAVAQSETPATTTTPPIPDHDARASDTRSTSDSQSPVIVHEEAPTSAPRSIAVGQTYDTVVRPITETSIVKLGRFDTSKPFETALPNGSGKLRLTKNDDGSIEVELQQSQVRQVYEQIERSVGPAASISRNANRSTSLAVNGPARLTGVNTTATPPAIPNATASSTPTISGAATLALPPTQYSTSLSARDGVEKEMLESDVELAKINLAEKEVQFDIAHKDGLDESHLRLAKLAVDRAKVELKRAELQLKNGSLAGRRQLR
jgi:beta-lactamase regulating signal transducer with metallopeptidase domain